MKPKGSGSGALVLLQGLVLLGSVVQQVLARDALLLGVPGEAAMLLAEEHDHGGSGALDVGQVDVDQHEADEPEHTCIVDDADLHQTTDQGGEPQAGSPQGGCLPQAQAGEEHGEDAKNT